MSIESQIRLLECKLQSFKNGYWKAKNANDEAAAKKWRDGCADIYKRIDRLKQV